MDSNINGNAAKKDPDEDVICLSAEHINALKDKIESLYLRDSEDRNRYGLMTLTFHLLKQIVIHQDTTKMTSESLSRIFVNTLESKIFLMKCKDPMKLFRFHFLLKTLIYHSYTIFVEQEWQIKDIVVASKCEIATVNLYAKFCRIRNKKKSQKWRQKFIRQKTTMSKFKKKKAAPKLPDHPPPPPLRSPTIDSLPGTTTFISTFSPPSNSHQRSESAKNGLLLSLSMIDDESAPTKPPELP